MMEITKFIIENYMIILKVIISIPIVMLLLKFIIDWRSTGDVRPIFNLLVLYSLFSAVFISLVSIYTSNNSTVRNKIGDMAGSLYNVIDWHFWGYYILFPFILTILIMAIIKTAKANR